VRSKCLRRCETELTRRVRFPLLPNRTLHESLLIPQPELQGFESYYLRRRVAGTLFSLFGTPSCKDRETLIRWLQVRGLRTSHLRDRVAGIARFIFSDSSCEDSCSLNQFEELRWFSKRRSFVQWKLIGNVFRCFFLSTGSLNFL